MIPKRRLLVLTAALAIVVILLATFLRQPKLVSPQLLHKPTGELKHTEKAVGIPEPIQPPAPKKDEVQQELSLDQLNAIRKQAVAMLAEIDQAPWTTELPQLQVLLKKFASQIEKLPDPYRSDLWESLAMSFADKTVSNSSLALMPAVLDMLAGAPESTIPGGKKARKYFLKSIAIAAAEQDIILPADFRTGEGQIRKAVIDELVGTIAGALMTSDPKTIPNALNQLTNPEQRQAAEVIALGTLAEGNRLEAASYFLSEQSRCPYNEELVCSIFGTGTFEDPERISALIRDAPPSLRRDWAIREMVDKIAFTDIESAQTWVGEIQDHQVKSEALEMLQQPRNYSIFKDQRQAAEVLRLMQGK